MIIREDRKKIKDREGQSVIGVGGQVEEEEGTKVSWTEGRKGSRWVWKCIHLPRCRDRNRATGSVEDEKYTTDKSNTHIHFKRQ